MMSRPRRCRVLKNGGGAVAPCPPAAPPPPPPPPPAGAGGERVLVTGATGGVGLAAVQLALVRGAEVTGQCSLSKSAPLRAMNVAVLARDGTPPAKSFDVVIDVVGGDGWQDRLDALRPGGRYATSGAVAGQ